MDRGPPRARLNRSEAAQIIEERHGRRVDKRASDRGDLLRAILGGEEVAQTLPKPKIDLIRDDLMGLLQVENLMLEDCPEDCYQHPDAWVVACALRLGRRIPVSDTNFEQLDYTNEEQVEPVHRFVRKEMAIKLGMGDFDATVKPSEVVTAFICNAYTEKYPDGDRMWDNGDKKWVKREGAPAPAATPAAAEAPAEAAPPVQEPAKGKGGRKRPTRTGGKKGGKKAEAAPAPAATPAAAPQQMPPPAVASMSQDAEAEFIHRLEAITEKEGELDKKITSIQKKLELIDWALTMLLGTETPLPVELTARMRLSGVKKAVMGE